MYPEDQVLVAFLPSTQDYERLRQQNWYRIPLKTAPKGVYAEFYAFYLSRHFGPDKWSIRFFTRQLGQELVTREDLIPEEPDHPRAKELYYKVQCGPIQPLANPILSLHWRRITFIHTTWDRFQDAREVGDLFITGEGYVDRKNSILKENGDS